jgi:hypothetical protein
MNTTKGQKMTVYETERFGPDWDFEAPEWFGRGDEAAEYYERYIAAYSAALYMGDQKLIPLLHRAILDMYYDNMEWLLIEDGRSYYPDLINQFPTLDEIKAKIKGFKNDKEAIKKALDWAVDWRTEHLTDTLKATRIAQLERELETLRG